MKHIILIALIATLLTGCSHYKPSVIQGNALDSTTIKQVRTGMSKVDVLQILGSPLMQDGFHANRWDYLYYDIERGQRSEQKNLILQFSGNIVSNIN